MGLFGPRGFAAEVVAGIDLESQVVLTGDRITIGTGPADDLILGAADIVPEHLSFQKTAKGQWEYFTTGRAMTEVDRGNPRTGRIRAGMWFQIGSETRVQIKRAELPAAAHDPDDTKIPLGIAIPAMVGMAAVAGFVIFGNVGQDAAPTSLRTTPWFTGATDIAPALDACLANDTQQPAMTTASAADGPFWAVQAGTAGARMDLERIIRDIIAETHLLAQENRPLEASASLRRIEYVLPLDTLPCPILSAARVDLALLELRGSP